MRGSLLLCLLFGCSSNDKEDSPTDTDTDTTDMDIDTSIPASCTPPPRHVLADIPDVAGLSAVDSNVQAVFEVDGDSLVGKFVRDEAVAEGALSLWQEVVLRIPTNQRSQLVQLTFYDDSGLAGFVDNSGTSNQTGRYGMMLALHTDNIDENPADPCAPLQPRRGTFDWTLIHEFGHLRGYADGSVDDFVETFGNETGDGEGYPEDGSPSLDGDFVSSYAERAGGDEDAAESFTAFVMLDPLPSDASVAGDKVRFYHDVTDYVALREALRVTEAGSAPGPVPAAPTRTFDVEVAPESWMLGTWEGTGPEGAVLYLFEADDIVRTYEGDVFSYAGIRDGGQLATVEIVERGESFYFHQVAAGGESYSETFSVQGSGMLVEHERLGTFSLSRMD